MQGKQLAFPRNRRLILDICQASRSIPAFPVERTLQIGEVSDARCQTETRISWIAIFLRSYGLVCQKIPALRQVFVTYPWNHLYEHPNTVASVAIHREDPAGGKRLIWGRIPFPEFESLIQIQSRLDHATHATLNEVFRDGIRLERLPAPLRRFSWWLAMRWNGRRRAKKIGTFSVSTLAGESALNRGHPIVATSSLSYSRCDADGACHVTLIADHRVLDGVLAAQALQLLEETLNGQVFIELQALAKVSSHHERDHRVCDEERAA